MDASVLTARRKARVIYFNYNERNCSINNGARVLHPISGGNSGFAEFGITLEKGQVMATCEEIALNCPTVPPTVPTESAYTFFTHTTYPTLPNYYYRVYNTATNAWSELIDSGYSVDDYTEDFSSQEDSKWFVIGYNNGSTKHVQIINPNTATIARTLTYSTVNNNGYNDDENGFFYYSYNSSSSSYNMGCVLFSTNTLIETTIGLDDTYYVYDIRILQSCVLVHMRREGSSKLYIFKGTTATMLQESYYASVYSNDVISYGYLKNEEDHITTIFCVDASGIYKIYAMPTGVDGTYSYANMDSFGINKDRFSAQFYTEGSGAVYVFNSTGTLIPVIKSNVENYYIRYYDDDEDQTGQSNIFAIGTYNEGYSDYGTGDIYVLFDGASEFQTISFVENQKYQWIEINSSIVCVPYTDGTKYYMKTISSTGSVNTILRDYELHEYTDLEVLNNYCYIELHTSNSKTWHILKNDGTLSANGVVGAGYDDDEIAGNVLMRSDDSTTGVFIDGQYTQVAYYSRISNPYPVLNGNTVFGHNTNNSANNVIVASLEHGIKYQTVPILDNYDNRLIPGNYIVFIKEDPFQLYVVTPNGELYTYITEDGANNVNYYNTENRAFIYYDVNGVKKYVIFNSDTNTFTSLSEPGEFGSYSSMYTNFPYQD